MSSKKTATTRSAVKKRKPKAKAKTKSLITQEIAGVILVFVSIFLGFVFYSKSMGIVGDVLKGFTLGVFGVLTYFLPVILLFSGILLIFDVEKKKIYAPTAIIVVGLISLLSLIHTIAFDNLNTSLPFIEFIKNSYTLGSKSGIGGGVLGALVSYPVQLYMGQAACYIIFIMLLVVSVMILTNFSIRAMTANVALVSKNVNHAVREKIEVKKQQKEKNLFVLDESKPALFKKEDETPIKGSRQKRQNGSQLKDITVTDTAAQTPVNQGKVQKQIKLQQFDLSTDGSPSSTKPEGERVVTRTHPVEINDFEQNGKKIAKIVDTSNTQDEPEAEKEIYVKPPYALLDYKAMPKSSRVNNEFLRNQAQKLEDTLKSFKLNAKVVNICRGPVVTRYEVVPAAGVRVSRIVGLADDIALNLAAQSIRIEAPIPGKSAVGIEVPNSDVATVYLKELIDSGEFRNTTSYVSFALGKDIAGKKIYSDISMMPHLLVAGATGSGKSVCINSIIMSILYNATPEDVRMIMIDPKVVELSVFNNIPHLLVPVVTDPRKAASALNWAVVEMQRRYKVFAAKGIRDINGYNALAFNEGIDKIPQILVIIDELADLMMVAPKEVEDSICRIAQLGRASGIHLVIATQRPSVDVITGTIKANIPSRIAFAVSSATDSRTIIDSGGAEKLLGKGDMLFYPTGKDQPTRVQGCFVTEKEVSSVVDFLKIDQTNSYDKQVIDTIAKGGKQSDEVKNELDKVDKMLPQAVEVVVEYNQASISMLQRRLRVGYARAARLIDEMEIRNIVAKSEGPKPREVLITYTQFKEMFKSDDNE
jgi:DNA segregation ATPase FtsK/SpoIIIE, S-DNA-T family